jgi:hypothetical protein
MLLCANTAAEHERSEVNLWNASQRASMPLVLPAASSTFAASCNGQEPPHVLMVPKTGSRTLIQLGMCPRYQDWRNPHRRDRIHFHSEGYLPCSIATLREPCERIVSVYKHMYELYHRRTVQSYCMYRPTPVCTTHWFHRATHVDEFVSLLRENWEEVLGHAMHDVRGSARHMIVNMPQYLWFGRLSHVVCTPQLDAAMPVLAARYGCAKPCAQSSSTRAWASDGQFSGCALAGRCMCGEQLTNLSSSSKSTASAHAAAKDWSGKPTPVRATDAQTNLSRAACSAVRELYARDTELWRHACARKAARAGGWEQMIL